MAVGALVRRALAHRGLLLLVVLLVAVVAAASGTTIGAVAATTGAAAQRVLTAPEPASLLVTTRLADEPAAQDDRVRATVGRLFADAPVTVERAETPDGDDTPFVAWRVVPNTGSVAPDDLAALADGSRSLHQNLRDDAAVAVRGLTVEGDLGLRAAAGATSLATSRAVATVPVTILALVALVAVGQVARLLSGARGREVEILVARGAAPRQVVAASAVEAATVTVLGSAVGTVVAVPVLGALGEVAPSALVVTGTTTAVGATGVLTGVSWLQARAVAGRRGADRSGRLRQVAGPVAAIGVVALAVVGMLRWSGLGTPVVTTADGVVADPLAVVAPALVLAAAGMVALVLLGPLARGWAMVASRSRGATGVLAARHVARGLRVVAVPMVLLVLSGGSAVLAASYVATTSEARETLAVQRVGTDVRVVLPARGRLSPERPAPVATAFAGLEGAAAAAPVLAERATVSGDPLEITALPVAAAADVVRADDVAGLVDPLGTGEGFAAAPLLGDGVTRIALELVGSAVPDLDLLGPALRDRIADRLGVDVALWVAADDGTLTVLDAGRVELGPDESAVEVATDVPADLAGESDLRLVAVDVEPEPVPVSTELALSVRGGQVVSDAGERPVDVATPGWDLARPGTGEDLVLADAAGPPVLETVLAPDAPSAVRFVAARADGAGAEGAGVPATLTRAAAARWDAGPGDVLEATLAGSTVPLQVAGVVERVPGSTAQDAALVDLGTLDTLLLRTSSTLPRPAEVWIGAQRPDDEAAVAHLATEAATTARSQTPAPDAVDVATASDDAGPDAGAPVRAAAMAAAVGAGLLALVGLAVATAVGLSARRGEVVVLRAVGCGPRGQGAGRALEVAVVGVAGVVAGLLAGSAVAALTVPGLALGVVGGTGTPDLAVDLRVLGALTALALVGVAGSAVLVAARVSVQVRDTAYRPEVR